VATVSVLVLIAALALSLGLLVETSRAPISAQVLGLVHSQSSVDYEIIAPASAPIPVVPLSSAARAALNTAPTGTTFLDAELAYLSTPGNATRELCWIIAIDPPPGTVVGARGQAINYDVVVEDAGTGYPLENWTGYSPIIRPGATQLSTIASSLTPPTKAFSSPGLVAANAGITIGVILFITFPSQLFNRSFDEAYDDLREAWERRLPKAEQLRRRVVAGGSSRRDRSVFVGVMLAGSLLGSLLSPRFGFNAASLAAFAATVVALLVGTSLPAAVSALYRHIKKQALTVRLHALPAGLAIAAFCVLISRLADFRPGYLYGIVCGVVFGTKLPKHEQGHVVALSAVTTLAVSVAAWFAWVPVFADASRPGASLAIVLVEDFLAAAFVSGLVGTVIGLLPFAFLPGGDLIRWHRGAWVATFAVALFGTVQVMLRPVTGPTHPGGAPIVTAIALFLVFGVASVGLRLYAVRRQRERDRESAAEQAEGEPAAEPAHEAPTSPRTLAKKAPATGANEPPGTGAGRAAAPPIEALGKAAREAPGKAATAPPSVATTGGGATVVSPDDTKPADPSTAAP
jgi:hypothetical protein